MFSWLAQERSPILETITKVNRHIMFSIRVVLKGQMHADLLFDYHSVDHVFEKKNHPHFL